MLLTHPQQETMNYTFEELLPGGTVGRKLGEDICQETTYTALNRESYPRAVTWRSSARNKKKLKKQQGKQLHGPTDLA